MDPPQQRGLPEGLQHDLPEGAFCYEGVSDGYGKQVGHPLTH